MRPRFHFSPPSGWMNDPNGLIYFQNRWHLFYQWEWPRHWGHAISKDLLNWENLPPALLPETKGGVWSGSALARGTELVAVFTEEDDGAQFQSIAVSQDGGQTFVRYEKNPVLVEPLKDFRDPAVRWHEGTGRWSMVVSLGDRLGFYASADLIDWQRTGEFVDLAPGLIWECPDLLEIDGRWVLLASFIDPDGTLSGAPMRYWVGDFDGENFAPQTEARILDCGPDFYAAVTFRDAPTPTLLGWMSRWLYADKVPNPGWQGQMSVARQLSLRGDRLVQTPIAPTDALEAVAFDPARPFERDLGGATLSWEPEPGMLTLERPVSPQVNHPGFAQRAEVRLEAPGMLLLVRDANSVEIFADDGAVAITALLYPAER